MPTWGELLGDINKLAQQGQASVELLRRQYLAKLSEHTKRNTILYASPIGVAHADAAIVSDDLTGFMEAVHGLEGDELDLIIHSSGGEGEVVEQIVGYLRKKFTHIRAVVPQAAMSAATMLCCGCNEIVMGKQSAIGPIDPQFFVPTQAGGKWVAGQLLQDEFKRAQVEVKADPASGQAWYPILTQYPPGILQQVTIATRLGRDQVKTWLDKYMFASDEVKKGQEIGDFLSNHASHLSHSRRIDRDVARAKGMKVVDLEEDNDLQDLVLSVFHLTSHLFGMTPVYKIIENQNGKAYLRMSGPPPPY